MAATYPNVIRPFTTKLDYVEDILAGDVNDVQDEIVAVETVVGVNPHYDTGLFTAGVVINNGTLSNRVKNAEAGKSHPFVSLNYFGSFNGWGTSDTSIPWTGEVSDTHGAWTSGTTVTIPRDGYYQLSSNSYMQAPPAALSGVTVYLLRIFVTVSGTTSEIAGNETVYPNGSYPDVRLSCSWMGYLPKGSTIVVNYLNSSGVNRTLTRASFQAAFLRGQ